jgi:hypothetical protein
MTDGSRPLVYDAVNSQGSPDLRHSVHGHRPEHLVFFLCYISNALFGGCTDETRGQI